MTRLLSIETWNGGNRTTVVACFACGGKIDVNQAGVADLDGPEFRAYYHEEHAPRVLCALDGRTDHDTDSHEKVWEL